MSALRGFGFTHENGVIRHWYIGSDGVKRWVVGDKPVDEVSPAVMSGGCAIKARLDADFSRLFFNGGVGSSGFSAGEQTGPVIDASTLSPAVATTTPRNPPCAVAAVSNNEVTPCTTDSPRT